MLKKRKGTSPLDLFTIRSIFFLLLLLLLLLLPPLRGRDRGDVPYLFQLAFSYLTVDRAPTEWLFKGKPHYNASLGIAHCWLSVRDIFFLAATKYLTTTTKKKKKDNYSQSGRC